MDTNKLKRFAHEARKILMTGVAQRLSTLGINPDVITERPQVMGGGATFKGKTVGLDFVKTWQSIAHNVESRGYRVVVEEAAYTWFNRLVAIRIMAKNDLIEPLLKYESETVHIPFIVTEARHGRLPQLTAEQQTQWDAIANDDSKTDEQFMFLISAWCDNNPIIKAAFGRFDDQSCQREQSGACSGSAECSRLTGGSHYSSMLIPSNILKDDGFVDMLNHADYLTDEDYRSPELIGWLYQFYISERKDEVFAKKGKYDSDEIPAATQIFTPNWIVKYMVQNTLGRIYLDANPWETELQKDWKYLVDTPEGYDERKNTQMLDLENLRTGDLACGSGHILNEQLGILYSMYLNDGYSPRNAIESIFRKNLVGIDIDLRAKQLATFSLLLKSCQIDRSLASAPVVPRVYSMPHIEAIPNLEYPNPKIKEEVEACFKLMLDAETLGSIMKFEISETTRQWIQTQAESGDPMSVITNCYNIILALTEKYDALAMNPPYMGGGAMNDVLSTYVKDNYPEGKADLATVFVQLMKDRTCQCGKYSFIIPPSWMFLSGFEALRRDIIDTQSIDSLLHLSRGVFGADFGASSAVITNKQLKDPKGVYFRLIERTFQEFDQKHLRMLFEKTLENHDFRYKFADYTKDVEDIVYSEDGAVIYYPNVPQKNFEKIPGSPIGYWVGKKLVESFDSCNKAIDFAFITSGLSTGDNNRFVRYWFEVNFSLMSFDYNIEKNYRRVRYVPYGRLGGTRRWYGLRTEVVVWENDGQEIKDSGAGTFRNPSTYFKSGLTWSGLCSNYTTFRAIPQGAIYDSNQNPLITYKSVELPYLLGFLNTKITIILLNLINPTFHVQVGDVCKLPIKNTNNLNLEEISSIVKNCISISKTDWDAHETSWDFTENELVAISKGGTHDLKEAVELYKVKWEQMFTQLHRNEEELNRLFIEIYGLQDELDYHVPFDEITILQQGEIDHDKTMPVFAVGPNGEEEVGYELHWNDDVIIKQLISYAVGCMMGRYSIDKPGLILANQGDGVEKFNEIVGESRFEVDDDGIVPLMAANLELTDNAPLRFKKWLEAAFGAENLVENINYVQQALGKTIEAYFQKDFWKDHKKMYQNRPIYWLFTSKKGAFQCLVYMHRMDPYTPERIRTRYLLPHIDWLKRRQDELQQRASSLNAAERRDLDNINKQIAECLEYHDRLHVIADAQQAIDLDDGVAVNYAKFGDVVAKLK